MRHRLMYLQPEETQEYFTKLHVHKKHSFASPSEASAKYSNTEMNGNILEWHRSYVFKWHKSVQYHGLQAVCSLKTTSVGVACTKRKCQSSLSPFPAHFLCYFIITVREPYQSSLSHYKDKNLSQFAVYDTLACNMIPAVMTPSKVRSNQVNIDG